MSGEGFWPEAIGEFHLKSLSENTIPMISSVWEQGNRSQFDLKSFAAGLHTEFGIYGEGISPKDVEFSIRNLPGENWLTVSNASYETAHGYCDAPIPNEEKAFALASVLLYLLAVKRGYGDTECCTDATVAILHHLDDVLDVEEKHIVLGALVQEQPNF